MSAGSPKLPPETTAYYALGKEHARLGRGLGLVEYARTCDLLERMLPPPPARILDVGGGTGVYARWLSERGYEVRLLDAMKEHVEQAKALGGLASAEVADARTLPQQPASVDAVLLLGPLYHLTEAEDRQQALLEAHRVLRPGGVLVAAGIPHTAAITGDLARGLDDEAYGRDIRERAYHTGQYRNPEGRLGYFTTAFFHRPEDLEAEVERAGFRSRGLYAVEGPAGLVPELETLWRDPQRRASLLAALRLIEREPALRGVSPHLLVWATKPETL